LTLEQRAQYHSIIDKHVGNDVQAKIDEKLQNHSKRLSASGRTLKVVEKGELKDMAKINQFSNGFGLFDKSKCLDIYKTVRVDGLDMYEVRS
jgi:hypothetical protein